MRPTTADQGASGGAHQQGGATRDHDGVVALRAGGGQPVSGSRRARERRPPKSARRPGQIS
ncbi:hypothetical protein PUR71_23980 [Streptomyces sp. SP17BM10]|uniref:hypothetical protein n=1 Tax=Streptomyces sp. SP17BM10 TaxID=3002530 RepID=UPI002E77D444|nr:hypothetical protein [Streptomyces sp. SP17BM10]MEE1785934.1 hypothetical protein [Streptomyces sp. SP17BM10]